MQQHSDELNIHGILSMYGQPPMGANIHTITHTLRTSTCVMPFSAAACRHQQWTTSW